MTWDCKCSDCICPCETCPCVPMCRHKTIEQLSNECVLFSRYFDTPHFLYKKIVLMDFLNPTRDDWDKGYQ